MTIEAILKFVEIILMAVLAATGAFWGWFKIQRPGITREIQAVETKIVADLQEVKAEMYKVIDEQRDQGKSIVKLEEKAIYSDQRLEQMYRTTSDTSNNVYKLMAHFGVTRNGD